VAAAVLVSDRRLGTPRHHAEDGCGLPGGRNDGCHLHHFNMLTTGKLYSNRVAQFTLRAIQLAQYRFHGIAISNAKILIYFQMKYTEAILSNRTRKLLWFEITKMLIAI